MTSPVYICISQYWYLFLNQQIYSCITKATTNQQKATSASLHKTHTAQKKKKKVDEVDGSSGFLNGDRKESCL